MTDNEKTKAEKSMMNATMLSFFLAILVFLVFIVSFSVTSPSFDLYRETFKQVWFSLGLIGAIFIYRKNATGCDFSTMLLMIFFGGVSFLTILFVEIYGYITTQRMRQQHKES